MPCLLRVHGLKFKRHRIVAFFGQLLLRLRASLKSWAAELPFLSRLLVFSWDIQKLATVGQWNQCIGLYVSIFLNPQIPSVHGNMAENDAYRMHRATPVFFWCGKRLAKDPRLFSFFYVLKIEDIEFCWNSLLMNIHILKYNSILWTIAVSHQYGTLKGLFQYSICPCLATKYKYGNTSRDTSQFQPPESWFVFPSFSKHGDDTTSTPLTWHQNLLPRFGSSKFLWNDWQQCSGLLRLRVTLVLEHLLTLKEKDCKAPRLTKAMHKKEEFARNPRKL